MQKFSWKNTFSLSIYHLFIHFYWIEASHQMCTTLLVANWRIELWKNENENWIPVSLLMWNNTWVCWNIIYACILPHTAHSYAQWRKDFPHLFWNKSLLTWMKLILNWRSFYRMILYCIILNQKTKIYQNIHQPLSWYVRLGNNYKTLDMIRRC